MTTTVGNDLVVVDAASIAETEAAIDKFNICKQVEAMPY
jgi:hypothetical protein